MQKSLSITSHKCETYRGIQGFLPAACETRWNGQLGLVIAISDKFEKVQEVFKGVFVDSDLVVFRAVIKQFQLCIFLFQYKIPSLVFSFLKKHVLCKKYVCFPNFCYRSP
jgi:hypothetical protein